MKYFKNIAIILFSAVLVFYACDDKNNDKKTTPQPIDASNTPVPINANTSNTETTSTSQNTGEVYHYTCANGCAGGAASAGNCSTCGNTLAHNQAFHSKTDNASPTTPFITPPAAESGSNTSGVFHYICGNGCAGGAAGAGNCSNCGTTLTHNTAYHQ